MGSTSLDQNNSSDKQFNFSLYCTMMTTQMNFLKRSGSPDAKDKETLSLSELNYPKSAIAVTTSSKSALEADGIISTNVSGSESTLDEQRKAKLDILKESNVRVSARFRKVQGLLGEERLDMELIGVATIKSDGSDILEKVSSLQQTFKSSKINIPFHYKRVSLINPNLNRVSGGLFSLNALNCEKQLRDLFQQVTFEDNTIDSHDFDQKASRRLSFSEKRSSKLRGLSSVKEKELNAFIHVFTKGAFADKQFLLYAMMEKDIDYFNNYVLGMIDSEWRNLARRIRSSKDGMSYIRTKLSIRDRKSVV